MFENEQWIQWKPEQPLSNKYDLINVINEDNSLILELIDDNEQRLDIIFEKNVESLWIKDEGYSIQRFYEVEKKYGDGFCGNWTFFKIANSFYFNHLGIQTNLQHFCFVTGNIFIDVFAQEEPLIKEVKL
jgi:hypothetical protein